MERIRPIFEQWIMENHGSARMTAAQMGIRERRLYALLKEQDQISEGLLDYILTNMQCPELWYTELADLLV